LQIVYFSKADPMNRLPNGNEPSQNDPLGEALHLLKLNGAFYCRSELSAPWGVELPPFEGRMMFHVVTSGQCWLQVANEKPQRLEAGSLALIPHGEGHTARSDPQGETQPLFDIPAERVSERYETLQYGGGGESTHITCGVVGFDHIAGQQLLSQLPRLLLIDTRKEESGWLNSTMQFIAREARSLRPGGETVITHLADILIIQAIRSWLDSPAATHTGWLAALRDRSIGRALTAIHREPHRSWSVESLARTAGLSRSGFSARFSQLVGESALRYLTRWRMQLARAELIESRTPLASVSQRVGYQSEAAFCRAFKREFGYSPGYLRRPSTANLR
jgi:AraC-like DNA-binding protein